MCNKLYHTDRTSSQFINIANRFDYFTAVVGMDGVFRQVSTTSESVTGYKSEELIGKIIFQYIFKDDLEKMKGSLNKINHDDYGVITYRLQEKTGDYKWVETTYMVLEEQQIIRLLIKDISILNELCNYLIHSEKLSIIGQMAAGIAHEIRNPLTSIKGFLQLMQAGVIDTRNYINIMKNEIDRIESITSELLFLGKRKESQKSVHCIQKLLNEVILLMQAEGLQRNIEIEKHFPAQSYFIKCDESKIKQVFINLIKNGMEAIDENGKLSVAISIQGSRHIVISITDTGCGIPKEKLNNIGQPFYTTKENGNGLGLMLCYRIIDEHQGKIKIYSQVDEGTSFQIFLPRVKE
ncbi:ATP-binding protein [Heyndrickxia ginsengihumi]|uniref:ATP-binding protein n=1 Tax=Heyndrickxia ginsengihumi TaxID=363870 RepID=UPI00046F48F1|nr:ATP-binding protein [Heyndrickxia ginsengihumi]